MVTDAKALHAPKIASTLLRARISIWRTTIRSIQMLRSRRSLGFVELTVALGENGVTRKRSPRRDKRMIMPSVSSESNRVSLPRMVADSSKVETGFLRYTKSRAASTQIPVRQPERRNLFSLPGQMAKAAF